MIKNPNIAPTVAPVVGSKAVMREGRVTGVIQRDSTTAILHDGKWGFSSTGRHQDTGPHDRDIIATIPADATPYREWEIVGDVMGWLEEPAQNEHDRLSELETAVLRLLEDVDALKRRKDKPPVDLSNPDCIAWKEQPKRWQKKMKAHFEAGGKVECTVPLLRQWVPERIFDPERYSSVAYRATPQAEEAGE